MHIRILKDPLCKCLFPSGNKSAQLKLLQEAVPAASVRRPVSPDRLRSRETLVGTGDP